MSQRLAEQERRLCELYAEAARGPKRNALFALWLLLRVAGDALPPHVISERAHRRRSEALLKRFSSLTLPNILKNPLHAAARGLADRSASDIGHVLGQLVPVVRDTLGKQAAATLTKAANLSAGP